MTIRENQPDTPEIKSVFFTYLHKGQKKPKTQTKQKT
jgi:hypothetical protein